MRERLSLSTLGYFTFIYAGNVMLKKLSSSVFVSSHLACDCHDIRQLLRGLAKYIVVLSIRRSRPSQFACCIPVTSAEVNVERRLAPRFTVRVDAATASSSRGKKTTWCGVRF